MESVRPDAVPTPRTQVADARAAQPYPRDDAQVVPLRAVRRKAATLTIRERRALELTANGLDVGEIAKLMSAAEETFISEESVKSYQRSGQGRLGARSLVHAIALAMQRRLIRLDF